MKKKEYESPEFDLMKFRFESLMNLVADSDPEDSGFIIDDPQDPEFEPTPPV